MGKFADKIEEMLENTSVDIPRKSASVMANDKITQLYTSGKLKEVLDDIQKEDELEDSEDRKYYILLKDYYFNFLKNTPVSSLPKYQIISSDCSFHGQEVLGALVNVKLAEGWKLYGSPFIGPNGYFYQALIK